jgi:hypothetical protein
MRFGFNWAEIKAKEHKRKYYTYIKENPLEEEYFDNIELWELRRHHKSMWALTPIVHIVGIIVFTFFFLMFILQWVITIALDPDYDWKDNTILEDTVRISLPFIAIAVILYAVLWLARYFIPSKKSLLKNIEKEKKFIFKYEKRILRDDIKYHRKKLKLLLEEKKKFEERKLIDEKKVLEVKKQLEEKKKLEAKDKK